MDTISAIETRYKGYRFRSRLEARWAMFFDRVGLTWTYESDPINVAGEAYLPDFIVEVGGKQVMHEVKSLHEADRIQPVRVYLAGKMGAEHCWRGKELPVARDGVHTSVERFAIGNTAFEITGPHRIAQGHYHTPAPWSRHQAEAHWCKPSADDLFARCMRAVSQASLFCLHVGTPDAYGSLVELGYARGFGCRISVTIEKHLTLVTGPYEMQNGHGDKEIEDQGHGMIWPRHDLWFAESAAHASAIVKDSAEAREFHAKFIREYTPREYRLISSIGTSRPAIMTFGDPLDVANRGQVHNWGTGLVQVCTSNRAAAEAVRAHRFDGR